MVSVDSQSLTNLLPYDGIVHYHGQILSPEEAGNAFERLLGGVEWRHDEAVIFGQRIVTRRQVAWYGDSEYLYRYSGTTKRALPWTPELLGLRLRIEGLTGATFNSCLINLYHDGEDGVGWHSDGEPALRREGAIASVSLGAERNFRFRHKRTRETTSILLEHGSLLVMQGTTQIHWLHTLPKAKRVRTPRINLTFRTIEIV